MRFNLAQSGQIKDTVGYSQPQSSPSVMDVSQTFWAMYGNSVYELLTVFQHRASATQNADGTITTSVDPLKVIQP